MQQLNLPPFNIKVAEREGQTTITTSYATATYVSLLKSGCANISPTSLLNIKATPLPYWLTKLQLT